MKAFAWNLWHDTEHFELGDSGARPGVWREQGTTNVAIHVEEPPLGIEVAPLIVSSYLYVATL